METTNSDLAHSARANRKRFTTEQRQELLTRFGQSQLSQREFAARENVGLSTLNKWVRQHQRPTAKPRRLKFQEVPLPHLGALWAVEVVSPQNWTLRLAQTPELNGLQRWLQALPC